MLAATSPANWSNAATRVRALVYNANALRARAG